MSSVNAEQVDKEVLPFLSLSARADVRSISMQYFLGLTGTADGQSFIASNTKYLDAIVSILSDSVTAISKDAYLALVNLTTTEPVSRDLINLATHSDFLLDTLKYVLRPDSVHADIACMLLSNLSRWEQCAEQTVRTIVTNRDEVGFDKIIQVFCTVDFNKSCGLHYLGPFLSNLTQTREARFYILDKKRCVIQRLLPYTQYKESLVRRGGIIGTLRNCCFETDYHEWLLGDSVDILPRLLLPLAGPEEFDDDDMEKLPEDLQYLEPDKQRESDPDIRKMLVEAIHQLLATQRGREFIRAKNAYVILRELDKWEIDPACSVAIRNTISIIIANDPESGMETLTSVEIPPEIESKLQETLEKEEAEIAMETKQLEEASKKQSEDATTDPSSS